jgi:hypothetical protein
LIDLYLEFIRKGKVVTKDDNVYLVSDSCPFFVTGNLQTENFFAFIVSEEFTVDSEVLKNNIIRTVSGITPEPININKLTILNLANPLKDSFKEETSKRFRCSTIHKYMQKISIYIRLTGFQYSNTFKLEDFNEENYRNTVVNYANDVHFLGKTDIDIIKNIYRKIIGNDMTVSQLELSSSDLSKIQTISTNWNHCNINESNNADMLIDFVKSIITPVGAITPMKFILKGIQFQTDFVKGFGNSFSMKIPGTPLMVLLCKFDRDSIGDERVRKLSYMLNDSDFETIINKLELYKLKNI